MSDQRVAICYGASGQDGGYLCELLLGKGYRVFGVIRRSSTKNLKNLEVCLKNPNFSLKMGDVTDSHSVFSINNNSNCDEIYNLARRAM